MRVQRRHQLRVGFLPTLYFVRKTPRQVGCQLLRDPDVAQHEIETGGTAGQTGQALRGAQRHDDGAAVEFTHTKIDQRRDAQRIGDVAGDEAQPVAYAHAQVIGQLAADDALARTQPRLACHDLGAQIDDTVVAVEFHTHQCNRLRCFATHRQASG